MGGDLLDPTTLLSGRQLGRAAKKLTKIELLPALRAYGREAATLESQRHGAELGLTQLGQRTGAAVSSAYDSLAAGAGQNFARQQAIANALNQQTQNINTQTQQAMTQAQTGALGDLTQSLASRNVEPGGSASQAALAQQVQAQQQAAAQRAQGYSQLAASQGANMTGLASAESQAEQMRGREAQSAIAQTILERIASSNADARAQIAEALGKKADTKALWGPTRLKNLLQLRGSEREYGLALHPPTKTSNVVNTYPGLNKGKKITAQGLANVARIQQQTQRIRNKGFKNLPSGGGGNKRRPRRP